MKNHFKDYWGGYALGAFVIALVAFCFYMVNDEIERQRDCLSKQYYWVDHHCYKTIIPAD